MPPRVFCDFNNYVDRGIYSLNAIGSKADLERLGTAVVEGQPVVFYDYDGFENGEPAWLLADGVVALDSEIGLIARIDPESFRWEPRVNEDGSRPAV
jgi:hypothetical protein